MADQQDETADSAQELTEGDMDEDGLRGLVLGGREMELPLKDLPPKKEDGRIDINTVSEPDPEPWKREDDQNSGGNKDN